MKDKSRGKERAVLIEITGTLGEIEEGATGQMCCVAEIIKSENWNVRKKQFLAAKGREL